eukprot:TRINITY_DN80003_c0_g1_i1.p1 TRINITY_DN80003_c0_g1~~TRINITY_DN80003_c0_g1_i1.p1  ORF type:complete len:395 (+),score=66.47 TRINITY_DN80003_c0_g1_i1:31-1185(+)
MASPPPGTYAQAKLDLEIEQALGLPQLELNDYFQEIERKRKYMGGFAEVYKAKCTRVPPGWDVEVGKPYAVKLFTPPDGYVGTVPRWKYIASEIFVNANFLPTTNAPVPRYRGAALWANRQRPWVVLVCDWVRGVNLREWFTERSRKKRPIPESLGRSILNGILQGLQELHAAGLAHRDVKPENIMLEETNDPERPYNVWLVDFTLCKYFGDDTQLVRAFPTPQDAGYATTAEAGTMRINPCAQTPGYSTYPYVAQQPVHVLREKVPMLDIFAVGLIALGMFCPTALALVTPDTPISAVEEELAKAPDLSPHLIQFIQLLLRQKLTGDTALQAQARIPTELTATERPPPDETSLDRIEQRLRRERTLGPVDQPDTQIIEEERLK